MAYRKVTTLSELWSGEMGAFSVGDRHVLLVHAEHVVYAYEDRCPHQGAKLSAGRLDGSTLVCSVHGWSYDVSTGRGINPSTARLVRFSVRIEGDDVLVDVAARDEEDACR